MPIHSQVFRIPPSMLRLLMSPFIGVSAEQYTRRKRCVGETGVARAGRAAPTREAAPGYCTELPVGAQLGEVPRRGSFILPLRRYGIRRLRRSPTFSAAVITVPALGIGLTTAMFSTVDAVLLRPLPFGDPNRLVTINEI